MSTMVTGKGTSTLSARKKNKENDSENKAEGANKQRNISYDAK